MGLEAVVEILLVFSFLRVLGEAWLRVISTSNVGGRARWVEDPDKVEWEDMQEGVYRTDSMEEVRECSSFLIPRSIYAF